MEVYRFASRYVTDIIGRKVPLIDRRAIMAINREEAAIHAGFVLNRPPVVICECSETERQRYRQHLIGIANAHPGRAVHA